MEKPNELILYQELKQELNHFLYPVQFSKDINLKLERITHLLSIIGNPQNAYPIIHIGGTSGKGSTSTMVSYMLSEAGYKTGLHTSPNLQLINEGFQINNKISPTLLLLKNLREIKPAIDEVARVNPFGSPSYFEVQVALALYLFFKEKVDIAVIEVGLGGTLDATNATNAKIAVLTNIGLDHTDILGNTLELIAQDKTGIIKPGQTVISGFTQSTTQKIVADRCMEKNAVLWQIGKHLNIKAETEDSSFSVSLPGREYEFLILNLLGEFQRKNAACAIAAVHAFDSEIPDHVIRNGLSQVKIPGRMEIVQKDPTVLLDGAHNADKIKAASKTVKNLFPKEKYIVVFALKKGKKYRDIIPQIMDRTSVLIATTFSTELWHSLDPNIIVDFAKTVNPSLTSHIELDPIAALQTALRLSHPKDLVWVTGSLYLVGNIRNYWHPTNEILESANRLFC